MPVDKAISWPLSQESRQSLQARLSRTRHCYLSRLSQALLQGKPIDQAPVLLVGSWLKNEQLLASHARYGAATAMNGLSTDCSTVFVRKLKRRA
jgi:hypothetical protein